MTEKTESNKPEKADIDWAGIELHYRAGVRPLRSIADEHGITHGAINKRANRDGWTRNLKAKIDARASQLVSKALVSSSVSKEKMVTERVVVEANASVQADAEMGQRSGMQRGMDVSYGLLLEVQALSNPRFFEMLEAVADAYDESGPGPSGAWKTDKSNELYRYVISLAGRAKTTKDIAASHTAYTANQRKVLRMDSEGEKAATQFEETLKAVHAVLSE